MDSKPIRRPGSARRGYLLSSFSWTFSLQAQPGWLRAPRPRSSGRATRLSARAEGSQRSSGCFLGTRSSAVEGTCELTFSAHLSCSALTQRAGGRCGPPACSSPGKRLLARTEVRGQQDQGGVPFPEVHSLHLLWKFSKPPRLEWEPSPATMAPGFFRSTDCPGLSWSGAERKEALAPKILKEALPHRSGVMVLPSLSHPGTSLLTWTPALRPPQGEPGHSSVSPIPSSPIKGYRMWESLVSAGCRNLWEDEFIIPLSPTAPHTCPQA